MPVDGRSASARRTASDSVNVESQTGRYYRGPKVDQWRKEACAKREAKKELYAGAPADVTAEAFRLGKLVSVFHGSEDSLENEIRELELKFENDLEVDFIFYAYERAMFGEDEE